MKYRITTWLAAALMLSSLHATAASLSDIQVSNGDQQARKVNRNLSSRLTYYFLVLFRLLRLLLHELVTFGSGIRAWKNGENYKLEAIDYDRLLPCIWPIRKSLSRVWKT